VDALFNAIVSFSRLSERERACMSAKSKEKIVQKFNWDKVAAETLQLISAV